MVADNSCEHETTGRQEGPQKPKIRCCNGEKIQGEALVAGVQKVIRHSEPKLGGGRVPQLEKEVVKDLIQLPQPRKFGVHQAVQLCQTVVPIVGRRDHQRFNKIRNIPEPAEGVPPMPFGGLRCVSWNDQNAKGQDQENKKKQLFSLSHFLRPLPLPKVGCLLANSKFAL